MPTENIDEIPLRINESGGCSFDDNAVARILEGHSTLLGNFRYDGKYLDLSGYSSYTHNALVTLAQNVEELDTLEIGFRYLTVEACQLLTSIRTGTFVLSNLTSLEVEVAKHLHWTDEHQPIRDIRVNAALCEAAAVALVGAGDDNRPLYISLPSINLGVAQALARHTHELHIFVPNDELTTKVAEALAHHAGYSLTVILNAPVRDRALHAFSSNPAKRSKQHAYLDCSRIYVTNVEWWRPESHEVDDCRAIQANDDAYKARGWRQVALKAEATGLPNTQMTHRLIEIGAVELVYGSHTGRYFHAYLNPGRDIDPGASAVHGISNEFLSGSPNFSDVCDELLAFINGAELLVHNASFHESFLNAELENIGLLPIRHYCEKVTDTLKLARERHPATGNSLNALCERYQIAPAIGSQPGTLRDAKLLADIYRLISSCNSVVNQVEHHDARTEHNTDE